MKQIKSFIALCLFPLFSFAASDSLSVKKNTFQFEAKGSAFLLTVKYERVVFQKNKYAVSVSGGYDFLGSFFSAVNSLFNDDALMLLFPLQVNGLFIKSRNYFEGGMGYMAVYNGGELKQTQSYLDYNAVDSKGNRYPDYYNMKTYTFYPHIFLFHAAYRRISKTKRTFWKVSWNPAFVYKTGYRREPFDKFIRINGRGYRAYNFDFNFSDFEKKITLAQGYTTYKDLDSKPVVGYKSELYLVNFGLSFGFNF